MSRVTGRDRHGHARHITQGHPPPSSIIQNHDIIFLPFRALFCFHTCALAPAPNAGDTHTERFVVGSGLPTVKKLPSRKRDA